MTAFYCQATLFCLLFCVAGCGGTNAASENFPVADSLKPTEVAQEDERSDERLRYVVQVWPTEIYLGDPIYFSCFLENASNETIPQYPVSLFATIIHCNVASPFDDSNYEFLEERSGIPALMDRVIELRDFAPSERREGASRTFAFPPLEDSRSKFWARWDNLPKEGVVCELGVQAKQLVQDADASKQHWAVCEKTFKIRVKPRPTNETALLRQWRDATSTNLFPVVDEKWGKIPRGGSLKSSGKSDIWVGWRRFDPWLFIRVGNRKPSDPNNPTTLDGWRKLEREFAPSATRDEIRLTRLQLEYYSAKKGEKSDAAKKELVDWLAGLPEPQRVVLTSFLLSKEADFAKTTLAEKNREALQTLKEKFGEK